MTSAIIVDCNFKEILLFKRTSLVFLQPCHVVYTDYRPTPLQHYIFPSGGDGIHLVVDEDGKFREDNFSEAMAVIANKGGGEDKGGGGGNKRRSGPGGGSKNGGETDCFKIVKMIMERNFAPVIVFSFSKKECEAYALQMSKLDFNTGKDFLFGMIR